MAGAGGVSMAKFEEYFQRADLDRDGRISGAEAVAFLQGSNLPRQVLAQIWMHADQNRSGFLARPEFFNALKLVTVAQSKRELTPDIVKAALFGPASSKIPPPQISTVGTVTPQPSPVAASSLPQTGATPRPTQNSSFRGLAPSSTIVNQQLGVLQSPIGMKQQAGPLPSSPGLNQQFARPSSTMNQQFGQVQPPVTPMNQQFGQLQPSTDGINQQFGQPQPSNAGINPQFGQLQPLTTGINQQFDQLQPSSTGINQQFGQLQPSTTGINQQLGQTSSSMNTSQNFLPSQGNQPLRQPQAMPTAHASRPPQATSSPNISWGVVDSGLPISNNELPGGKTGAASTGPATQILNRGASLSSMSGALTVSPIPGNDAKDSIASGNQFTSNPVFAGGFFSANHASSEQVSSPSQQLANSSPLPTSSVVSPITSSSQPSPETDPFKALQSTVMKPSTGIQASQRPSLPKSNQQTPSQVTSGVQADVGNSTIEQSQISWPKITRAGFQKYAKVFMEVDSDRDGKITGDQARNLFLSWRLPREVLKQVWDLADQDSDSMLSLREFCIALYLMERYKEGRSLPPTLPQSVMFDETLLSLAGPPTTFGRMGWGPNTGLRPQQVLPGAQPMTPTGVRPLMQPVVSQPDMQFDQKNVRGPFLDNHVDEPSNGELNSLETKALEAEKTNEKVHVKENVILDSREKLEFYRTKMQDLVLYKSRCDNRLNEITERARADKSEAELLDKKYQEKYKQVAEIHSKVTIEEAAFREIQERKTELQQAIIKMEQGGSVDGILQVRADRIQSDLEELLKALPDRCKKHSVEIKSVALIELPTGWESGIPEAAAIWDEDWDKFEDEGFSFDVMVPATADSKLDQKDNSSPTQSISTDSISDKLFGMGAFDAESVHSADESRSPQGSIRRQTIPESPSQKYSDNHFRKSFDGDAETQRSFDEPSWGNFDNSDDIDSIWGFNAKESDARNAEEKYFFGSNGFNASPERGESPDVDSPFQKKSPFTFEDSFPGSPLSRPGNSPRYSIDSRDATFDNFSRYDSFSTRDVDSSSHLGNLTGFDSVNSARSFDHSSTFSFDDSDPFGSTGPFKASSETPK